MGVGRYIAVAASFLLAAVSFTSAQVVADRITTEINTQSMSTLQGSVPPVTKFATNTGRMNAGTRLQGLTLRFALSDAQNAELDALLQAQQTPGSASYHQWLTPATYASRFGVSDADLSKVESWLEQQGFVVDSVSNSHTTLRFSGSVSQVESAFRTEMHTYTVDGKSSFSNSTDVSIPAALSGLVQGVQNLSSFKPKSHVKLNPNFTSSTSGSYYTTPSDIATIYGVGKAYSAGYTGSGQSIAVVGQSAIVASDITNFQTALGWTTTKSPTVILVPSSGTSTIVSGDEGESDLDLEYTSTIAKGSTIYFVYTGSSSNYSVWDSIAYAVDTRLAPIISVSYGSCEAVMASSDYSTLDAVMKQGASQGQSIIVSSGDDGSAGCYYLYANYGSTYSSYAQQLSADYPASSAYATAIGGTEFPSSALTSTYWTSASGSDVISSALSYVPEVVWNDSSSSGLSSGGGGVSVFAARPTWQSSTVPGITSVTDYSGGMRLLPDISLDSSPSHAGFLYCSSDTDTGISGSCSNGFRDTNSKYLTVAGGTSFAAPIFAGMLAILNQAKNYDYQGLINTQLYTLATNSTHYSTAFHDITSGNNACTGVTLCSTATSGSYSASTGFDEATGLGSIDLYELLNIWPANSTTSSGGTVPAYGSTTKLTASATSVSSGTSVTVAIAVASASSSSTAAATGTVSLYVDGTVVNSALALSSGAASYSFSSTTSGAHTIVAIYSGSSTYFASTGSVVVTVAGSTSTGSGGSAASVITVTPSGGYTGTVGFQLYTSSSYLQNYACYTVSNVSVAGTAAVTQTLTLYLGTTTCSAAGAAKQGPQSFKTAMNKTQARNRTEAKSNLLPTAMAGLGLAGLLMAGLVGRKRRSVRNLLCALAMVAVGFAVTGCSNGSSSSSSTSKTFAIGLSPSSVTISAGTSGVPTGSYSLTVEGYDTTSTSNYATAALTMVVN